MYRFSESIVKSRANKTTMVENVIAYFSITTKPKVTIFDDKSTSIQFYGQWHSPRANTMNTLEVWYTRNWYMILEAGRIF